MWNASIASGAPRRWVSKIPAALAAETQQLARRNGATLFSTLLGAFQIALSKWTGAKDILVGTPVANRSKQTSHQAMGYFSGIVPLRCQIEGALSVSDHLRAVQQMTIDSFAIAMPFVELVQALGEQPAQGHNPIFEVRFALQNHPVPEISLPNLSARLSMRSTGTARFQLGCEITEDRAGPEVAWLFRENLFSQRDIEGLDGMFQRVLSGVCRSPEGLDFRFAELTVMSATITAENFSQLHEPHWVLRSAFQLLVFGLVVTEVLLRRSRAAGMDMAGGVARLCSPAI